MSPTAQASTSTSKTTHAQHIQMRNSLKMPQLFPQSSNIIHRDPDTFDPSHSPSLNIGNLEVGGYDIGPSSNYAKIGSRVGAFILGALMYIYPSITSQNLRVENAH